jgi:uncharacterized protein involved in outer membrane biogenesis
MKKLWIALGVIVLVIVGILIYGASNLGPIIKQAVNTKGPEITGTKLHLGDVDVALFSGQARLQDFLLGNPSGFDAPNAMTVKSIKVDLDEKSLLEDTVIIDRIEILKPEIYYERKGKTDNFQTILDQVKSSAKSEKESGGEPSGEKQPGKKLLIRDFVVSQGQVNLAVTGLKDQKITAELPEIQLQNIGGEKQGVVPAEAARQIVAALYQKVASSQVREELNRQLQNLGAGAQQKGEQAVEEMKESMQEKTGEQAESATEKIKGLLDR